jgi:hypothetical protein
MSTAAGGPGYERSDVSVRGVMVFAVVLVASCGLLMAAMAWLYGAFGAREATAERALPPATRVPLAGPQHPPAPVIQAAPGSRFELEDPRVEMEDQLARMERILTTSGWVDRNAGIIRIPIEDAKELLLERGLPVRREETPAEEATP